PGVQWLIQSGAVHELPGAGPEIPEPRLERFKFKLDAPLCRRAEAVAAACSFRNQSPCADGAYPAMLFRASSRFNHSCFPNAGGFLPGGKGVPCVAQYKAPPLSTYALEEIAPGEEVCSCYLADAEQLAPCRTRRAALQ
ncbi:unnamed protein product, partial [Polarella glacialis]